MTSGIKQVVPDKGVNTNIFSVMESSPLTWLEPYCHSYLNKYDRRHTLDFAIAKNSLTPKTLISNIRITDYPLLVMSSHSQAACCSDTLNSTITIATFLVLIPFWKNHIVPHLAIADHPELQQLSCLTLFPLRFPPLKCKPSILSHPYLLNLLLFFQIC